MPREAVVEGSVAAVVAELGADLQVLAVGVVGERGDDDADGGLPEGLGDAGRVAFFVAVELGAAGEAELVGEALDGVAAESVPHGGAAVAGPDAGPAERAGEDPVEVGAGLGAVD